MTSRKLGYGDRVHSLACLPGQGGGTPKGSVRQQSSVHSLHVPWEGHMIDENARPRVLWENTYEWCGRLVGGGKRRDANGKLNAMPRSAVEKLLWCKLLIKCEDTTKAVLLNRFQELRQETYMIRRHGSCPKAIMATKRLQQETCRLQRTMASHPRCQVTIHTGTLVVDSKISKHFCLPVCKKCFPFVGACPGSAFF